jgi:hypothetical protein
MTPLALLAPCSRGIAVDLRTESRVIQKGASPTHLDPTLPQPFEISQGWPPCKVAGR